MLVASFVLLGSAALVTWVLFAMASMDEEMRRFSEFDGLLGDAAAPAADELDTMSWPAPG